MFISTENRVDNDIISLISSNINQALLLQGMVMWIIIVVHIPYRLY